LSLAFHTKSSKSDSKNNNLKSSRSHSHNSYQNLSQNQENTLHLQQELGNQEIQRMIKSGIIQPKLKISHPNDPYEREADKVADQIMRMSVSDFIESDIQEPHNKLQRKKCSECEMNEKEEEFKISRKSTSSSSLETPDEISNQINNTSGGKSLDSNMKSFMESRFNHDFSNVRIHDDSRSKQLARSVNARAFTTSNSIFLGENESVSDKKLMAHELTHVVQQRNTKQISNKFLQRSEKDKEAKKDENKEETDAGKVIVEGLKTVGEQAKDNNPKVKKKVIEPLKKYAKQKWSSLSGTEKGVLIGHGAVTYSLILGSMLSDPKRRKVLEDINIAAPLGLIPYMPLTSFKYTLPSGETKDKRQFQFHTSFSGDDYLKILSKKTALPDMSMGIDIEWRYDPINDQLKVGGAQAKIGLMPGVTLSGGTYSGLLKMPDIHTTPEGSTVESRKRIPAMPISTPTPDVRFMLTVDLLKLDPSIIGKRLHRILRAF